MRNRYRMMCAALAWFVITLQYGVLLADGTYGGFGATTLTYFGFFTILTNILVALAFSVPFMSSQSRLRRIFEGQAVRAAIALYILVVGVVYYALLAKAHNPEGISAVLNVALHFLLPVLYILDWLVFAKKDSMSFKAIPLWVIYPLIYGVFNILRGAVTGFYPYPFLDASKLGVGGVSVNMLGFIMFYAIGGLVFIGLGRILPKVD